MNCSALSPEASTTVLITKRKVLWDKYGIRSLLLLSLGAQTIVTIFGNRRRFRLSYLTRFVFWLSYLMASPVVTLALGKLSGMLDVYGCPVEGSVEGSQLNFYDEYFTYTIWLAPLLLLQVGSPNVISFSVEDNKLKLRQFIGLTTQVAIALWIFYKSFGELVAAEDLSIMLLYVAGIIKVAERIRALWSISNSENAAIASFSKTDIRREENPIESSSFSNHSHDLCLLVKAYQRFDRLKPYLENWFGHLSSVSLSSMSVEDCVPKDVFRITEFELSFMYDVLYTKAPINYSKKSLLGRIISFLALVSFCICFIIYVVVQFTSPDVIIQLVLFVGAIVLEIYEMKELLCSDWALLHWRKKDKSTFMGRCLSRVAPKIPRKNHRWNHCVDQFNLLSYGLYEESTKLGGLIRRIPKVKGYYNNYKKYCVKEDMPVPEELKKLILEQILEIRAQRGCQSFSKRGEWALERCNCLQDLEWSLHKADDKQTNFGQAIFIWHIATNVCYCLDGGQSEGNLIHSQYKLSKVLSEYMMYFLAMQPDMLAIVTGDILFRGVCAQMDQFLKTKQSKDPTILCTSLLVEVVDENYFQGVPKNNKLTSEWNVLLQVQKLTRILQEREDRWSIISSVWVEMLCYGASNCPWTLHAEQLRRGGELLTHVWLLLEHEKDQSKFLSRELE